MYILRKGGIKMENLREVIEYTRSTLIAKGLYNDINKIWKDWKRDTLAGKLNVIDYLLINSAPFDSGFFRFYFAQVQGYMLALDTDLDGILKTFEEDKGALYIAVKLFLPWKEEYGVLFEPAERDYFFNLLVRGYIGFYVLTLTTAKIFNETSQGTMPKEFISMVDALEKNNILGKYSYSAVASLRTEENFEEGEL